jgi:hypothetical protein
MRRSASLSGMVVTLALALIGCAAPAATAAPTVPPTPSAQPAASPTVAPTASPTAALSPTAVALPATPLRAVLDRPFASQGQTFDESRMAGLGPGDLVAHWYQDGTWFIVAYVGLDIAVTGPLCPGNSLQVGNGFQYVSNSPTGAGACEGVTTYRPPPVGPRLCGREVLYQTAIPAGAKGILWASINHQLGGGAYVGLAGVIDGSTGSAPQISLDALGCRMLP